MRQTPADGTVALLVWFWEVEGTLPVRPKEDLTDHNLSVWKPSGCPHPPAQARFLLFGDKGDGVDSAASGPHRRKSFQVSGVRSVPTKWPPLQEWHGEPFVFPHP